MTEHDPMTEHDLGPGPRHSTMRMIAALCVAVVAALGAGVLVGSSLTRPPTLQAASDRSVDAGFARDMAAHHTQAIQLSVLVRDRTQDPTLRLLALDILTGQQEQVGQMNGWLDVWGLSRTGPGEPMDWMTGPDGEVGHVHGPVASPEQGKTSQGKTDQDETDARVGLETMPGWVLPGDLARLEASDGVEAERLYLTLMIDHHLGGVDMARYAAANAEQSVVVRLASGIVTAQSAEITLLTDLLDERGGPTG